MDILVCDDERVLAEKTAAMVSDFFKKAEKPVSIDVRCSSDEIFLDPKRYDMAFLDVEIDKMSGIDVTVELKKLNRHIVVFIITSYDKYLDNAMDLNVFRFIMKPVSEERLHAGIEKALGLIDNKTIEFFLSDGKGTKVVRSDDIICVAVEGRGTVVTTADGVFNSDEQIRQWRERLTANFFFSPHRGYIINFKYVTGYTEKEINMANSFVVPVSTRNFYDFKRRFVSFIADRG